MERKQWPGLSFGTYQMLYELEEKHGKSLAAKVAEIILREKKRSAAANRNGEDEPRSPQDE
jgi:hypothetical protein